ncbi:hypothetical protein BKA67DRAFT_537542 [Truncatella angustata]|uniref:Uncharacterized protein n=1 Tax=Truncatella angustata TaxID=152316 RepID=A0A9P8UG65_9PEZI|nr:uncharacterized protein BKA67DRAFT_537542 [Truncatella angustata]KAH6651682.1 hypothetical protein BKA67DRAFT_537542 [Truncatella angustata]
MSDSDAISADSLGPNHYNALSKAIHQVLTTDLAIETYAQIIDGLPLCDVAWNRYQHRLCQKHPINSHKSLCPGSIEKASSLKNSLDLSWLSYDDKLLRSYRASPPGSLAFGRQILELVAVAVHKTAIYLFRKDFRLHDQHYWDNDGLSIQNVTSWQSVPMDNNIFKTVEPWPTLFTHPAFTAYEQYPNGVADMVGYWAEDRILGGVLLFDRTKDGGNGASGYEPNVYLQSSRPKRTYLIYQLTDAQQQSLLDFLLLPTPPVPLSETSNPKIPAPSCLLPLLFSSENLVSIDPEFAVVNNKIYRDVWERPPPRPYQGLIRDRDVVDTPGAGDTELEKLRRLGL